MVNAAITDRLRHVVYFYFLPVFRKAPPLRLAHIDRLQWPPREEAHCPNVGVKHTRRLIRFRFEADVPFPACSRGRGCVHLPEKRYKMPSLVLTSSDNSNIMDDVDEGLNTSVEIKVSSDRSSIRVLTTNKLACCPAG